MNRIPDAEDIARLEAVVAEAEAFNRNMEERGYHSGGPPDIEGVYDSRIWLLAGGVTTLLAEVKRLQAVRIAALAALDGKRLEGEYCQDRDERNADECRRILSEASDAKHRAEGEAPNVSSEVT